MGAGVDADRGVVLDDIRIRSVVGRPLGIFGRHVPRFVGHLPNGSRFAADRLERRPMTDEVKQSIGKALGKVPSGVYILTATHAGESSALLVSWVQQAAFAPPSLTIAMARERPA